MIATSASSCENNFKKKTQSDSLQKAVERQTDVAREGTRTRTRGRSEWRGREQWPVTVITMIAGSPSSRGSHRNEHRRPFLDLLCPRVLITARTLIPCPIRLYVLPAPFSAITRLTRRPSSSSSAAPLESTSGAQLFPPALHHHTCHSNA